MRNSALPLLFCATEAGGAQNIARVASASSHAPRCIVSPVTRPIFLSAGIPETALATAGETGQDVAVTMGPRGIVCGTCRPDGFERRLIRQARRHGIPSVAVLDEWYDYRLRFADGAGELSELPDMVCCQDTRAQAEAEAEGLPSECLTVTGSPYFAFLVDLRERYRSAPPPRPAAWPAPSDAATVLLLSETHAADYGAAPGEAGPLGPYLGYTEDSVAHDLLAALESCGRPATLVERRHPSDLRPVPPRGQATTAHTRAPAGDLWPQIWHADIVVGMRSIALLEARLLGRPTASYQPGAIGPEKCTAVRLGLIRRLETEAALADWLSRLLARSDISQDDITDPPFSNRNAATTILARTAELIDLKQA